MWIDIALGIIAAYLILKVLGVILEIIGIFFD